MTAQISVATGSTLGRPLIRCTADGGFCHQDGHWVRERHREDGRSRLGRACPHAKLWLAWTAQFSRRWQASGAYLPGRSPLPFYDYIIVFLAYLMLRPLSALELRGGGRCLPADIGTSAPRRRDLLERLAIRRRGESIVNTSASTPKPATPSSRKLAGGRRHPYDGPRLSRSPTRRISHAPPLAPRSAARDRCAPGRRR